MTWELDHVFVATPDVAAAERELAALGLAFTVQAIPIVTPAHRMSEMIFASTAPKHTANTLPLTPLRFDDLADDTPLLDVRIATRFRGQGLGTAMLRAITAYVFAQFPERHRLGGYTRDDNVAMSRAFTKAGYTLEARHRRSWRVDGGGFVDALGYAILREDSDGERP